MEAKIKSQGSLIPNWSRDFGHVCCQWPGARQLVLIISIVSCSQSKAITAQVPKAETTTVIVNVQTPGYCGRVMVGSTRGFRPDIRDIDLLVEVPEKQGQVIEPVLGGATRGLVPVNRTTIRAQKAEIQIEIGGRSASWMWTSCLLSTNLLLSCTTGPVEYNRAVRRYANQRMSVSQYSVTVGKGWKTRDKILYFPTEKKVLTFLELPVHQTRTTRDNVVDITMPIEALVKDVIADLHTFTL